MLGGFLHLGMVSFVTSPGCKYLFLSRLAATSLLVEPFLALVPRFLRTAEVAVDGLKIDAYASTSVCGGGSLCWGQPV